MEELCSTAACVCVYFPMYLTKSCRLNFSVHWATLCPCILVRSKLCKRIKKTHSSEPQLDESWRWKHGTSMDQKPTEGLEKKRKEKTQTCRRSTSEIAAPSFTFDPDVVDAQLSTRWLRVLFLLVVLGWSAASCVLTFMTFYRTTIVHIHVLWYQFWTIVNLSNLKQTLRQDVL